MILTLTDRKLETPTIETFFFTSQTKIDYDAGQFFYVTLPSLSKSDPRGNMRHLSVSSSPTEELIAFSVRFPQKHSAYKSALKNLALGSQVNADGPHGVYSWPYDAGDHIFIAGGIGIAPMRSRIKYVFDKKLKKVNYLLIYSVHDKQDEAFGNELLEISKKMANFKAKTIFTEKVGRLNKESLAILIPSTDNTFWVCGKPEMVDSIEESLVGLGIRNEKILTEKFTGY